jgi:hypothetical protein
MLRKGKKAVKEESEQIDEVSLKTATSAYVKRMGDDGPNEKSSQDKATKTMDLIAKKHGVRGVARATKTADDKYGLNDPVHNPRKSFVKQVMSGVKEESEQIQEYTSVGGKFVHRQKEVKDAEAGVTDWDKEEKMAKDADKPAAKKRAYGAHQNRRTNTKLYKEMIESLKTGGIKSLFKTIEEGKIEEEASQEEFTKEMQDQKAKFDGKKKGADFSKPPVYTVKQEEVEIDEATHTEIQVIDMTDGSQKPVINVVDLEEKSLTEPEMKKKEEVVKSMKKGIAGFKERYGDRAKSVMYATATKRAMGEEVEQIDEAVTHGDYTITHKPYNGTDKQRHVSNDITHAYSTNQKKFGIKYSKDEDEIGPDRHITVKNNKTGEVSHHVATHNNTYKDEHEKQKISIRAHGEITPHDDKHAKVIKSFLAPTKVSS